MAITLYSRDPRIIKSVTEWASPIHVEVADASLVDPPKRADVVVTMGALDSKDTQFLAMRLGAMPVVLPEGGEWLGDRIAEGRYSVLAGSDLATQSYRV